MHKIALILGFTFGLLATNVIAEQIPRFTLGTPLECAFDQPATDVAEASAFKAGVTIDSATETILPLTCVGASSPFQCKFMLPATGLTLGMHTMSYRIGRVEFDDSISFGDPIVHQYAIDPLKRGAPAQPINSVIRALINKLLAAIGRLAGG